MDELLGVGPSEPTALQYLKKRHWSLVYEPNLNGYRISGGNLSVSRGYLILKYCETFDDPAEAILEAEAWVRKNCNEEEDNRSNWALA